MKKYKNEIAAIISFIVLFLIMWGTTYWWEIEENSARRLIITNIGVFSAIGTFLIPAYIFIEKPFNRL